VGCSASELGRATSIRCGSSDGFNWGSLTTAGLADDRGLARAVVVRELVANPTLLGTRPTNDIGWATRLIASNIAEG
jgi:hypothetical protein